MLWCWGGGEGDTEIQRDILIDLFFEKKEKSWGRCDTSIWKGREEGDILNFFTYLLASQFLS